MCFVPPDVTSDTDPENHGRALPSESRRTTLVEAQRVPRKTGHGARRCSSLGIKESPGALKGQARALHIDAIPRDMSYTSSMIWGRYWAAECGRLAACDGRLAEGIAAGQLDAMVVWHCTPGRKYSKNSTGLSGGGDRSGFPLLRIGAVLLVGPYLRGWEGLILPTCQPPSNQQLDVPYFPPWVLSIHTCTISRLETKVLLTYLTYVLKYMYTFNTILHYTQDPSLSGQLSPLNPRSP